MTDPRRKGYLLPDTPTDPVNTSASDGGGPTPMTHSSSRDEVLDTGPGGQGEPTQGRLQARIGELLRDPPDGRYAFVTFHLAPEAVTLEGWVARDDVRDALLEDLHRIPGVSSIVCRLRTDGQAP